MDYEFALILLVVFVLGGIAIWRDPRTAGQVIKDIFTQFSKREKPNDFKRDDEDGDSDRL